MKNFIALVFSFIFGLTAIAQDYSNYAQQTSRLERLSASSQYAKLSSLIKTSGGKNIWMLTIGTGNANSKPAIAVVGGVEGNHLLGTELAIGFAEKLLAGVNSDSVQNLLRNTIYYIFPNMSPDAMEQYFAKVKYERMGNATSTDDDRDGKLNEDGYDDLDGNGKITMMRVASPIGEYRIHPDDARVVVKADITKSEKGSYRLYTEGHNNDKDSLFNEDGEGGVWFNKNLSYRHPSFSVGSGDFAVSEPETRALLDTLYQLFNVYAVVSFSSSNNLSAPVTYSAPAATQRIVAGWLEDDVKVNAMVSDLYNKTTKAKDAPKTTPAGGDFFSWAYYHYGRYSFSTPGWWVPKVTPDTARKEKAFTVEDPAANYLRWASRQGITNTFTEWKQINHPDFPGQKVEVGGLDPFVLTNPPYRMVDSITRSQTEFLVRLAGLQPRVDIANVVTEKLGNGLTRITADILNTGALPSHSKIGERSYWVKRINVRLNTNKNQAVISGKKNQLLNALEGYSSQKLSWLVKGNGKITLEAGSPSTGTKQIEITL
ncbi:MAG TPA: M14 family metallopeptidase [Flavisolibacter sp.]|nr:M14 family metallopeptidase [Flavisolibacter sp.]